MDTTLIIKDLKKHLNLERDIELADFLGIKQSTLATWKHRGNIDVQLIISKCKEINPNWLLTGEGSMLLEGKQSNNKNNGITQNKMQELIDQLRKEIERLNNEQAKKDEIINRLFDSNVQLQNLLNQLLSNAPEGNGAKKREAI